MIDPLCVGVELPVKDGIVWGTRAGLCPENVLLVEWMRLGTDNAGDERCGLWPMEGVSAVPKVEVLAERAGLGTGEPRSETVRQTTAEGVAMARQSN
jgi:hypothetical protein